MPRAHLPVQSASPSAQPTPARKRAPAGGRRANSALKRIEHRRANFEKDMAAAIDNRLWSQVPGLDGIITGLLLAERLIKEEACIK